MKFCYPEPCRYTWHSEYEDTGRRSLLMRHCGERMSKIRAIHVDVCRNCETVLRTNCGTENVCKKCNYRWSPT